MSDLGRVSFSSFDDMVSVDGVGAVVGMPVESVRVEEFTTSGWATTGARFHGLVIDDDIEPRFIVKTSQQSTDWLAIASLDTVGREVRVWESGLLDRIGAPGSHATVATAR